jgi:putative transposase
LSHADLDALPGSDARKLAIALLLSKQTGVQQGWIAEQLKMKSAANVSQQLRRLRDETRRTPSGYLDSAAKLSRFFD